MAEKRIFVGEAEWLFRRSYSTPERNYVNPDGTATSRVFKLRNKDNGELSVDVKSLTTPEKSLGDDAKFILFELANQVVINVGLETYHDPCTLENDGFENPAHAVIIGMTAEDDVLPGLLARKSKRLWV